MSNYGTGITPTLWWARRLSIGMSNRLARYCRQLTRVFEELENQLDRCPACGARRFYDHGCRL